MILLQTERLCIRTFRPNDWQDLYEYRSDEDVCKYQGYQPYNKERCKAFAESQSHNTFGEAGKWAQLAIEHTIEKKVIGDIGIKPESFDIRLAEFGITLSPLFQGKGLANEAMHAVLLYLFNQQQLHRITGITDQENESCISMLSQLGFRKEGVTRQSFWNNNLWRDEYIYAMIKTDFID